jgi:hypothetical protein
MHCDFRFVAFYAARSAMATSRERAPLEPPPGIEVGIGRFKHTRDRVVGMRREGFAAHLALPALFVMCLVYERF